MYRYRDRLIGKEEAEEAFEKFEMFEK